MRHPPHLSSTGLKSQPPGYGFSTTDYEQFQVIFVASGRLFCHVRDQDTEKGLAIGPGHVLVLPQHSAFRLSTDAESGYGGVFCVRQPPLPAEFQAPRAAHCPADRTVQMLAGLMQQEIAQPGAGSSELLAGLGHALAWVAVRLTTRSRASSTQPDPARYWTAAVRQAIHANLYTARGVRELLAAIPMSYRQLARYFRQVTGSSPKQQQLAAKLTEAQRLLTETDLPITTIALELGFPSSQHFATRFQQFCGHSPGAYRRRATR